MRRQSKLTEAGLSATQDETAVNAVDEAGPHRLLQVRTQNINGDRKDTFGRWYPAMPHTEIALRLAASPPFWHGLDAGRADQGQQTHIIAQQRGAHCGQLPFATDQRRWRNR